MGKVTETTTENKTKGNVFRTSCPECNKQNQHTVIVSADYEYTEDIDEYCSICCLNNYQVIQCKCGYLSFRQVNWCSELQDHEWDGRTVEIYPKTEKDSREAKVFKNTPDKIQQIYTEAIAAFNNECHILCAAGLRGIVEGICAAKEVKDGPVEQILKDGSKKVRRSKNLDGKISGLVEKEIITKEYADILHEHRFLGNEAIHELEEPSPREIRNAIEIIEHIIEQLFEIPRKAAMLTARRLSRAKK